MITITVPRALLEQALEVLELGYDTAKAEADRYHTAMAGFRPERHAQMDAEVQQIAAVITALRAALAQVEPAVPSDCADSHQPVPEREDAEERYCYQMLAELRRRSMIRDVLKGNAAAIRARGQK